MKLRSALGTAVKRRQLDEETRLRGELKVALLARHIDEAMNAAPPITDDQRDRLMGLLIARNDIEVTP